MPVNNVTWLPRERLVANNYNPNKQAPAEAKLLRISMLEDGWTQPIVVNQDMTIVDGFHRWSTSAHKDVYAMTDGMVPCVILKPTDLASQKMSTIRHNRARGTHAVLGMAEIIQSMVEDGKPTEEIEARLGMEKEEVTRLAMRVGIPETDLIKDADFSRSWRPGLKSELEESDEYEELNPVDDTEEESDEFTKDDEREENTH